MLVFKLPLFWGALEEFCGAFAVQKPEAKTQDNFDRIHSFEPWQKFCRDLLTGHKTHQKFGVASCSSATSALRSTFFGQHGLRTSTASSSWPAYKTRTTESSTSIGYVPPAETRSWGPLSSSRAKNCIQVAQTLSRRQLVALGCNKKFPSNGTRHGGCPHVL